MKKMSRISHASVSAALLLTLSTHASAQIPGQNGPRPEPPGVAQIPICDQIAIDSCHGTEGVTPPKLTHYVDAEYPEAARRERLEGASMVRLIIDQKGNPHDVAIKHSIADNFSALHHEAALKMDENAVKAVKKFRFVPCDGEWQARDRADQC